jgi:hypothetical protein
MEHLNWKSGPVSVQALIESTSVALTLNLTPEDRGKLIEILSDVFAKPECELKLELPSQWTLFIKSKPSQSRFSVSRPTPQEWVGSLCFSNEHAALFLKNLGGLKEGVETEFSIAAYKPQSPFSNLKVYIRYLIRT